MTFSEPKAKELLVDPSTLQAGRDTDKLVAECLGYKVAGSGTGALDYSEFTADGRSHYLPRYSTSDAALEALEEFRTSQKANINIMLGGGKELEPWGIYATYSDTDSGMFIAPTLWLAVCRLIVSVLGQGKGD